MTKIFFSILVIIFLLGAAPLEACAAAKTPATAGADAPVKAEMWAKRCQDLKSSDDKKAAGQYCESFQRLAVETKKGSGEVQRVAEFAIGYPPGQKEAIGVFILPLGLLLEKPVSIAIDDKYDAPITIRYCLPDGCYSFLHLPDGYLKALQKGKSLMIKAQILNGQNLHIVMDLTGLEKAILTLKK